MHQPNKDAHCSWDDAENKHSNVKDMVYTYFQGWHGNFLHDILVKIETDLYNDFKTILLGEDY